jgi:dihydroorotate dehydrogenase electron transfer subunit
MKTNEKHRSQGGMMRTFRVANLLRENETTHTLLLNGRLPEAQPGQFVMAWLPEVGEKPFSIHASIPLALTICDVGPVSHALVNLQAHDRVWIRGPLGNGFELKGTKHLLVGGGYGAAPLSFLAQEAIRQGGQVVACLGAKTKADLILVERLSSLGCDLRVATEDGSEGHQGLVTEVVKEAIDVFQPDCLYACGPTGMLLALADLCKLRGLPAQLSFEALMRCGVGLCGSCELPEELCQRLGLPGGWLVCHDGPVAMIG